MSPPAMRAKLEALGVAPVTRADIINVMLNPFVDRHRSAIDYAKIVIGLNPKDIRDLVEEVAVRCLEVGCKGKLLRRLVEGYPHLKDVIEVVVVEKYQLGLEHLPDGDDEEACAKYRASLCREYCFLTGLESAEPVHEGEDIVMEEEGDMDDDDADELESLDCGEAHKDATELVSIPWGINVLIVSYDHIVGTHRSRYALDHDTPRRVLQSGSQKERILSIRLFGYDLQAIVSCG